MKSIAGTINVEICPITKAVKLAENSDERTVAIGGPNTIQHTKDRSKSLEMTKIDFFFLESSLRVLPIKFMGTDIAIIA